MAIETQFYIEDLQAWVPLRPKPIMTSEYEYDTMIEHSPGEFWLFRGIFPKKALPWQIPWGLYLNEKGQEVFWGKAPIRFYPKQCVRRIEAPSFDTDILNDIKNTSNDFVRKSNSSTLLHYEHYDDESAIIRFIKDRINPMNKDLSYIMNELQWDQSRAYNLHNSLKKKRECSVKYSMYWFRLIGVRAYLKFEDVGIDTCRQLGIQNDFEIIN